MRNFESYHPATLFIYFCSVVLISMLTLNPIIIAVSFVASVCFYGVLSGSKKLLKSLLFSLPLLLIVTITNPLFVHRGETVLFVFWGANITLEALLYGLTAAFMLTSVIYWFMSFNVVMTSDKFVYLFGRILPKISLLLSMSLRFIPSMRRQYKNIDTAQRAMGMYSSRAVIDRIRAKLRVMSILITWSLENSVDTADSMRARGYGLKRRSSYSIYSFSVRRLPVFLASLILTIFIVVMIILGYADFSFYPTVTQPHFSLIAVSMYTAVFILMFFSLLTELKESARWRLLQSKI